MTAKGSLAKKLLEYAKKNPDGFTVKIKNGKITPVKHTKGKRFVVSKTNNTSQDDVRRTFKNDYTGYAGGWYDTKTKKYYIDKNVIVRDKSKALQIARKTRQKAIFDLKTFNEINLNYKNPIIKKNGRYYNKLTKRYLSKSYGKRLQNYFKNNPSGTLYRATGHGVYKKKKPIPEHSLEVKELLYGKGTQVIKTKTATGKTVYYSPIQNEVIELSDIKRFGKLDYWICNKKVRVELYRMTRDKLNIYHIFTYKPNRSFADPFSFEVWGHGTALKVLDCILDEIKKNIKKLFFGKLLTMYGHFNVYLYSDIDGYEAGRTFGFVKINKSGFEIMRKEFLKIIDYYTSKLENQSYHNMAVLTISIYMYDYRSNTDEKAQNISKYRIGVNRVYK